MRKIIFVLTYNEGEYWHKHYPCHRYKEFFGDHQVIFLDNGSQQSIADWCHATGSIHHRSENNLGTTGGYNWFFRVGAMLQQRRIAVMQADVQVFDTRPFDIMLADHWDKNDFCYWPNQPRKNWFDGYIDPDVGQFFSIDPIHFLNNGWLCDENYTVTHFESMDLWIRITSEMNSNPAKINNLLYTYFTDPNLSEEQQEKLDQSVYRYFSFTNFQGQHNPWFLKNFDYFQKKWCHNRSPISPKQGYELFRKHGLNWSSTPWLNWDQKGCATKLNTWRLETERNTVVGQLPYPVEYEVNRFYTDFVKTGLIAL